jgi:hypothetical protein
VITTSATTLVSYEGTVKQQRPTPLVVKTNGWEGKNITVSSNQLAQPTPLGFLAIAESDVRDPRLRREASCHFASKGGRLQ